MSASIPVEFVIAEPADAASVSWDVNAQGVDLGYTYTDLGEQTNNPGLWATTWYPGPLPPFDDSAYETRWINDQLHYIARRNATVDAASAVSHWVGCMVLMFDTSWLATTMLAGDASLRLTAWAAHRGEFAHHDYRIRGAWYSDANLPSAHYPPYLIGPEHFDRDAPTDDLAFEVSLDDVGLTLIQDIGDWYDTWPPVAIEIPLDGAQEHMNYGSYTGLRIWYGSGEAMTLTDSENPGDESFNEFTAMSEFWEEGAGPVLSLELQCGEDEDEAVEETGLAPHPERYRDLPPSAYLDRLAMQRERASVLLTGTMRRNGDERS